MGVARLFAAPTIFCRFAASASCEAAARFLENASFSSALACDSRAMYWVIRPAKGPWGLFLGRQSAQPFSLSRGGIESYLMMFCSNTRTVFSVEIIKRRLAAVMAVRDMAAKGLKARTAATIFCARGGLVLTRGPRLFRVAVTRVGSLPARLTNEQLAA